MKTTLSRRQFIKAGALTLLGTAGAAAVGSLTQNARVAVAHQESHHGHDPMPSTVGEVDHARMAPTPVTFSQTAILAMFLRWKTVRPCANIAL